MKKFNTAVLCLSHFSGGMELDSIKMTKGLIGADESCLLVCRKKSFISSIANEEGLPYEEIDFKKKLSFKIIFGLRKIIKKHDIVNIIFLGTSEIKSIFFSLLGMDNVNLIVRYGTTMSTSKKDPIHRLFYSRVNTHLSISKHLEKNIKKIIPLSKNSKSVVIYTSTEFYPYNHLKDIKQAVHIGRITPGKGQLDAIESILHTDLKLNLIGSIDDQEYLNKINKYIENKNLENRINITGFTKNPQEIISTASVLIFPSKGEGLSNALIEALGHGLICVCYNNTVFPEFKEIGFHIHLAESKDKLIEIVRYITENHEKESLYAQCNIELAREKFSPKNEFSELIKYLN